jgi:hypothetical protein
MLMRLRVFIVVSSCILGLISASCANLFFQPGHEFVNKPFPDGVAIKDQWIKSDGLILHSWYLYPEKGDCRSLILYLHGNAENISTHTHAVAWLAPKGYCVLAPDYRGYGKSEGSPDIDGINNDAVNMLAFAVAIAKQESRPLIVFGQSLGGALAIYAVANAKDKSLIAALIVEGTFFSYSTIATEKAADVAMTWPLQPFVSVLTVDRYSPDRWADKVAPVPLLIMHGAHDRTIPIHHGKDLFNMAREPKQFWKTLPAGHAASFRDPAIRDKFLEYLTKMSASRLSK